LADFANEISTDTLAMAASDIQSRSDILSVMACSALLLNVLSDQDFATRERDKIALVGYAFKTPYFAPRASAIADQLTWLLTSVTKIEPVTSVHVFDGDFNLLGASGVVHTSFSRSIPSSILEKSPILTQALDANQEVYLPDLQILPGKVEFTYLPINAQSVLIIPLANKSGVVVVATNQAKALKFLELKRIRAIVDVYSSV